ncbi:MAG TPA: POTRA domain-containing protein, partial [Tepidisphaeraceae bacterium]
MINASVFRITLLVVFLLLAIVAPLSRAQSTQPLATADTLLLREVRFEGNTVFTSKRLEAELKNYLGQRISVDQLEEARLTLTRLYVQSGYITSGVVLPDQDIDPENGVVLFKVVEGKLDRQNANLRGVDGADNPKTLWFRPSFILDRIMAGAGKVLNINALKDRLELLRQNPNIKRINAELEPGAAPGESRLDVKVEEEHPIHFGIEFSNRRPPSVGANRFELFAYDTNLTGNGDALNLRYTLNKGQLDDWEWAGLDEYSVAYAVPLNPSDTTFEVNYQRDDSPVIEAPFNELNITSQTDSVYAGLRQPVWRTTTAQGDYREFVLTGGFSFKQNTSKLLGEPFSFSPGAENGRTRVSVVRLGQELNFRNQDRAMSLRSIFSIGIDAMGMTEGDAGVDGQF